MRLHAVRAAQVDVDPLAGQIEMVASAAAGAVVGAAGAAYAAGAGLLMGTAVG